jgi:hypothetical protein
VGEGSPARFIQQHCFFYDPKSGRFRLADTGLTPRDYILFLTDIQAERTASLKSSQALS